MAYPALSREVLEQTVAAVAEFGTISLAARALGVNRATMQGRYDKARALGIDQPDREVEPFEVTPPPDADLPVEELLKRRSEAFRRKSAHEEARRLIPVKVKCDGPVGIAHFGDPHVDDDGTNVDALQAHVRLCQQTEGLFAGNVGDTTNNWVGRLGRLYGEQSTTAAQAWKLAEWLVTSMTWLYMIGGNHDLWSGSGDPLKWMARQTKTLYTPSGARMGLKFPNGRVIRLNARHDFKGNSQWNTAHGPAKAAQMGWRDHILTCGHLHVSGYQVVRDPATRLISHAIRVGSYKTYDRYADTLGLPDQNIFVCPVTIIRPQFEDSDPRQIQVLMDPESGADYLTFLRRRKSER